MSVDVVDSPIAEGRQCHRHAPRRALARGRDHVRAVGGCAISDQLTINLRPSGFGSLQLLQDHHAATAGNHETVAVIVVGTGGFLGGAVILAGHRAHGVE